MKKKINGVKTNEIEQDFKKGFNRSSKILENKLGINAARLLSMFVYKHNYWVKNSWCTIMINNKMAFYIIYPNIQIETNLTKQLINKAIKKLESEELIEVHKRGIPAKNYYIVNGDAINKMEKDHESIYNNWCKNIDDNAKIDSDRFKLNTDEDSEALCFHQLDEKQTTSDPKNGQLASYFSTVTNNNTNNNTKNNLTNRINAADKKLDLMAYSDKLEKLIDDVKEANDDEKKIKCNLELFDFLCEIIPRFKGFNISPQDFRMIEELGAYYHSDSNQIAYKILINAQAILDGSKSIRFGNLFVGLKEINSNCVLRYR